MSRPDVEAPDDRCDWIAGGVPNRKDSDGQPQPYRRPLGPPVGDIASPPLPWPDPGQPVWGRDRRQPGRDFGLQADADIGMTRASRVFERMDHRVMRLPVRSASVAFMALILLSSCSSSTTTVHPVPTAVVRPVPASTEEMAARLVTVVPAGFMVQPDGVGDTGPSDLAKAARDDGTPGAEQALRSEGFVRGYQRLWIGPDDAEIIVIVYQFETPVGANADFQRATPKLTDQAIPGATPFTVNGLHASKYTAVAGTSQDTSAAVILSATGVFVIEVTCNGPALAGLQERASAVATDQEGQFATVQV